MISFFIPLLAHSGFGKTHRRTHFIDKAQEYVPVLKTHREDRYSVHLTFHHLAELNGDLDNRIKAVLDAIKGKTIYDDWNVKRILADVCEFSDKTGVQVTIEPLAS